MRGRASKVCAAGNLHEKGRNPSAVSARRHSQSDAVVWDDGCFRIEDDTDGVLWVTEILHGRRAEGGDVPKRWRLKFESLENASRFIARRLREGHNDMFHFHTERKAVAG